MNFPLDITMPFSMKMRNL